MVASFGTMTVTETPEGKTISFKLDYNENYVFQIIGTDSGAMDLSVWYDAEDNIRTFKAVNITEGTMIDVSSFDSAGGLFLYCSIDGSADFFEVWYSYDESANAPDEFYLTAGESFPADVLITSDLYALTWNTIKGLNDSLSGVTSNLNLPNIGIYGSTISWESSEPAISASGVVTRGSVNTQVTLTAAITNGGESDMVTFILTVPAISSGGGGGGGGGGSTPTPAPSHTFTLATTTNSATAQISQSNFNMLTENGTKGFSVDLEHCILTYDTKAAKTIYDAADGDIVISVNVTTVDGRLGYEFTVKAGNRTVSDFGGGIVMGEIPYTLNENENPNFIVVYYLATDAEPKLIRGHYDPEKKAVVFMTKHFSQFMIGYNPVEYADVTSGWYKDAVDFIAAREYPIGITGNLFEPNKAVTRGEFTATLMRAYGVEIDPAAADNFDDVDAAAAYAPYLATAKSLGIAKGVGDNRFAPENTITREEMFVLLYRTLVSIGETPSISATNGKTLSDFTDAESVAAWAKDEIEALLKAGMIDGTGNNMLSPKITSDRATMAQMIRNLHIR